LRQDEDPISGVRLGWDIPVGGCGIVEYCCVSGSLAYSRILYEQMTSKISTLTHSSTVRKNSRRFAPSGQSILGFVCVFGPFAYLRIAGFPLFFFKTDFPYPRCEAASPNKKSVAKCHLNDNTTVLYLLSALETKTR